MSSNNGFTPLWSDEDIKRWFGIYQEKAEEATYNFLVQSGERFIGLARKIHTYDDHTGNLRSSIGYVIAKEGSVIIENFEESPNGTDKKKGMETAKQLAKQIAGEYPTGLVLICLAGMQYASYVEAGGKLKRKGKVIGKRGAKDVITGSATILESEMRKGIEAVFKNMGNGR
jgi:hypothetical protein